jgi:hypothetical protein
MALIKIDSGSIGLGIFATNFNINICDIYHATLFDRYECSTFNVAMKVIGYCLVIVVTLQEKHH